ncbi:flagellar protein FlaG [Paenibacillus montanisoli]|uniref:Flagellar biosynthesis protein FlaG n=1 Tax=Paenibacillus montanisoli TaxID=2081970 RepID=A0A328TTL8_9BACL|nr:flagellar protein FlaG [Paenibacillus montanisoli]RAP73929.1 flagellar biosynthesis protein FlaG [Paenibacillus montanisoli]
MNMNLPISNVPMSSSVPNAGSDRQGLSDQQKSNSPGLKNERELKQAENNGVKVPLGEEILIKAIEKANKAVMGVATSCEFSIHEKTKQIMVKVVEKETGKLIREVPPEKILDLVAAMCEKAGIWIDERR